MPAQQYLKTYTADTITVRVTPNAAANRIKIADDNTIRITVTTIPEDGKANKEVIKLLAKALGVPKSSLSLLRGQTAKDKTFRIER